MWSWSNLRYCKIICLESEETAKIISQDFTLRFHEYEVGVATTRPLCMVGLSYFHFIVVLGRKHRACFALFIDYCLSPPVALVLLPSWFHGNVPTQRYRFGFVFRRCPIHYSLVILRSVV